MSDCCISDTFIIMGTAATGCTANHNQINSCDFDTSIVLGEEIVINSSLVPEIDESIDLGSTFKRYRELNVVSGQSVVWNSSISVSTPNLDLGFDSEGDARIITADNSILKNDNLIGGAY